MTQTNNKPSFEVADILREHIGDYQEVFPLLPDHYKIVHNLLSCRTAELGGHVERCDHCGIERISYNSCRNRHCPKCQNIPRESDGLRPEKRSCCQSHTSITSSPCLMTSIPLLCRTRTSC